MTLIDRDAVRQELVKAMERNLAMFRGTGKADARVLMALQYAIAKLDSATVVDAVPVRHGKWIIRRECVDGTFFTGCRCSECNYWKPMDIWKYCPNCGAKMGDEHGAD